MNQEKYNKIVRHAQKLLDISQELRDECEGTELSLVAKVMAQQIGAFEEALTHVTIAHTRYTNAPEAYDYGYVRTVRRLEPVNERNGAGWREVEVTDLDRFVNYQTPRYGSGMYQVVETYEELDDAI